MGGSLRITQEEKDALIADQEPSGGLGIDALFIAYVILVFSLIVLLPKIYLASNIYYVSRDIAKLQTQENLLKEENHRLKSELEDVKFKYLMMDLS
ncbi:hypothetical protein BKH46_03655 [Helicobacter sp. 12S02634-8]|uniref:hypothetical protein n=1 Tax=Helicobacter sp. 12S02634-8 TaxID=1476199 RepID=UPI000BA7E065|nr:hypothetical protein [Helicobacter sp. 12S02634-8]PAF47534.1 hypothetical protein BKH46_03655 [Helicobacter sp. 12S02634-8]